MINSLLGKIAGSKAKQQTEVGIEYYAPHWIVVIRNPGQKHWAALRSKTKFIRSYDEFGEEVAKRPAIESFPNMAAAEQWIKDNMPSATKVVRSAKDVEDFGRKLKGEALNSLTQLRDPHVSKPYASAD